MFEQSINNFFGEPIYSYSRAQALNDGVLVDVTQTAREAGFKIPVAVTNSVWDEYICWINEDTHNQTYQDESGRLWDVLWMLNLACKRNPGTSNIVYRLYVIPRDGRSKKSRQIELKAIIGGGDNGEPVITIMLPKED